MRFACASVMVFLLGCGGTVGDDAGAVDDAQADCSSAAECDDGSFCNGEELCTGGACTPGEAPCAGSEVCTEADASCTNCADPDEDADGFDAVACGGSDCDDGDPDRFPGNAEVCDQVGHDEDCDTATLGSDLDGDGHISNACCNLTDGGELSCGRDCDDTLSGVHPGISESCNGVDEDCDGLVDETVTITCHADADNDGYAADGAETREQCGSCTETDNWASPPSFPSDIDCNDGDASVHPGATELCDDIDSDCSHGGVFPAPDEDGDRDGFAGIGATCTEDILPKLDCNDRDERVHPGQARRYGVPHCPSGADVGCRIEDSWYCRYPAQPDGTCDTSGGVIPGASTPSWDFNCNGEYEPAEVLNSCSCAGGQCGEMRPGVEDARRPRGPAVDANAEDCGTGVPSNICANGAGGSSCGVGPGGCILTTITTPNFIVPCR